MNKKLPAAKIVGTRIDESIRIKTLLKSQAGEIARLARVIVGALRKGGKVVLFGNGGSAADAQHIAAELVGRYEKEGRAIPAIALTTNTSNLTAIANDYGYGHVFERQVLALCDKRDVVIGISTSGNSENVVLGIRAAASKGARTVALTGSGGGRVGRVAWLTIRVPSNSTARIQECHILIGHVLSELVENELRK